MTWTYSGDPSKSELDEYRFEIGDTSTNEPVLQDEEISFILNKYSDTDARLHYLYDKAAQFFARRISRKLGPQSEFTSDRQKHFEQKALYYKSKLQRSYGLSLPAQATSVFSKGMHDNV
jgi:hypothetical protein